MLLTLRSVRSRFILAALAVSILGACAAPAPPVPAAADMQPTSTVEDLMRALIDPAADALWDAVVITSTPDGLDEQRPETVGDWMALERSAIMLVESGNLLQIEGRRIAGEHSVSELPDVDLAPQEIAVRVAEHPDAWRRSARELHDAGVVMLDAVRARDVDALLAAGDRLDVACENCHARFWYRDDPADAPAR